MEAIGGKMMEGERKHRHEFGDTTRVNRLLCKWKMGDKHAYDELVVLLHEDLKWMARRRMIRERNGHTLQTQNLVNELYIKLLSSKSVPWSDRAHFFGGAAQAMRRILIDYARTHGRRCEGRPVIRMDEIGDSEPKEEDLIEELLFVERVIEEVEKKEDKEMVQLANLKLWHGMTLKEIALVQDRPRHVVERHWKKLKKVVGIILREQKRKRHSPAAMNKKPDTPG